MLLVSEFRWSCMKRRPSAIGARETPRRVRAESGEGLLAPTDSRNCAARCSGISEVAEYFLRKAQTSAQWRPMGRATRIDWCRSQRHTATVAWLLANGADPNYRYAAGYSPFLLPPRMATWGCSMLLGKRADLSARTNDGKTP